MRKLEMCKSGYRPSNTLAYSAATKAACLISVQNCTDRAPKLKKECLTPPHSLMRPLTLFYMGGVKKTPLDWLSYANPRGMPKMGWFFMTLYLSILERSWEGHFWHFFLKFPKNFASTIFSTYNPKGGPFYASVRTPFARNFFVLFWVKNGNNSNPNA